MPAISRPRVLILADVPRLTSAQQQAIDTFLAEGGSVWVILGERVQDRDFYNRQLYRDGQGWLPAELLQVAQPKEPAAPDTQELLHPALALFRTQPNSSFGTARFGHWWQVQVPAGSPTTTLALLSSGEPMLLERPYKKGTVLLSTVPFDTCWQTTLPRVWEYPVLVHELLYHLAGTSDIRLNVTPGQPLSYQPEVADTVPLPTAVRITRPDGQMQTQTLSAWPFTCDNTQVAGIYRLTFTTKQTIPAVVQAEADESALVYMQEEDRHKLQKLLPLQFTDDPAAIGQAVVAPEHRENLWWLLMLGVIGLLCAEIWLTRRMVRDREVVRS